MCPVCGQEGVLIRRVRRGDFADVEYFYVRHYVNGEKVEHGVTRFVDKLQPLAEAAGEVRWRNVVKTPGGDVHLVYFLLQLAPPHVVYVEVFGGGAALLLSKPAARVEVYNDRNSRLVNMFMCIASRGCAQKLIELVRSAPPSRALWEVAVEHEKSPVPIDAMPSAEEAFYTLYARYWSRSGHVGESFAATGMDGGDRPKQLAWLNYARRIAYLRRRLKHVVFENLDWRRVIRRYDKEYTWFYLDPPHHNTPYSRYFAAADVPKWTRGDFIELLDTLKNIRGKFTLKYTWDEDVEREIAARGFKYVVAQYRATESGNEDKYYIFAMNYTPQKLPRAIGYVRRIVKTVL